MNEDDLLEKYSGCVETIEIGQRVLVAGQDSGAGNYVTLAEVTSIDGSNASLRDVRKYYLNGNEALPSTTPYAAPIDYLKQSLQEKLKDNADFAAWLEARFKQDSSKYDK